MKGFLNKDERQIIWRKLNSHDWDIWRVAHNPTYRLVMDIEYYAESGYLDLVEWARKRRCPWNHGVCSAAAKGGQLEVLQWLRANRAPWNEWVCTYAAENGHLEVLQWARANGAPWDKDEICPVAAMKGYLDIIVWARDHGTTCDAKIFINATTGGHLNVLKWAKSNIPLIPWNEHLCSFAAFKGHLHVIQWALSQNPPAPLNIERVREIAKKYNRLNILEFINNEGFPQ
jgi:hypothetical protein